MAKDYGIDKGFIQYRNDSDRNQRGWGKGFFGFRKMFRDYLTKLNVAFFDACCPEASEADTYPVRYSAVIGGLEVFNGTEWVAIASAPTTSTTTTTTVAPTTSTTTTTTVAP